tara:strand:+ start:685 stop:924 length:240 start_codon:yes stop_codon:yes gene_type:complete
MGPNFDLFDQVQKAVLTSDHLDVLYRYEENLAYDESVQVSGITQIELDLAIEQAFDKYFEAHNALVSAIEEQHIQNEGK